MSADNLVQALPFKKSSGAVVWRVMEVTLSGFPYETCYNMSTKAREQRFIEYSGPDASVKAAAAAARIARDLPVCEYGTSIAASNREPLTMDDLRAEAVEAGYDVDDLFEAADVFWEGKPKPYWHKP